MPTLIKTCQTALTIALGALTLLALDAASASSAAAQGRARVAPTVELGTFEVTGTPHGPGAFYLLERGHTAEPARELRRTFVREIVESVRDDAF